MVVRSRPSVGIALGQQHKTFDETESATTGPSHRETNNQQRPRRNGTINDSPDSYIPAVSSTPRRRSYLAPNLSSLLPEPPLKKPKLDNGRNDDGKDTNGKNNDATSSIPGTLPLRDRHPPMEPKNNNDNATTSRQLRRPKPPPPSERLHASAGTRRGIPHYFRAAPQAPDDDGDGERNNDNADIKTSLVRDEIPIQPDDAGGSRGAHPVVGARERRSLRSHDGGSRAKSELAPYFSNYEEILSLEPTEKDFLAADTNIYLIDDLPEPVQAGPPQSSSTKSPKEKKSTYQPSGAGLIANPLLDPYQAQAVEILPSGNSGAQVPVKDPLDDEVYFKSHKRIERREKQLRNMEKERAQHEKIQLERLLDELQSHDWLRVMGISGVTDTEKKLYEPKRAYFIKEVSGLLEKFRAWKEEEKRRKAEKEQQLLAEDEENEQTDDEESSPEQTQGGTGDGNDFVTNLPSVDDVDAWAARQLQQEAMSASPLKGKLQLHRNPQQDHGSPSRTPHLPRPLPPIPQGPFTSFYSKPHLRDAALGRHRRGRTRTAFGQPLPDIALGDFRLPNNILTDDAIRACSRRNRRKRREQKGRKEQRGRR